MDVEGDNPWMYRVALRCLSEKGSTYVCEMIKFLS